MARIGPYEVIQELGRGGMGQVLRARGPDGKHVAVKVLLRASARAHVQRFERERRLLESLGEAEGFVPLLDAGDSPAGPYIVMPYVPGGTLRERIEKGPLAIDAVVNLGRALARALAIAHRSGIVHRDLKPENVLFSRDGEPLVADLGLAKHFDDSAAGASASVSLTRAGELRGTPGFMPPEQQRNAKDAGPPADVFALGAILHECLTGKPAFSGDTLMAVLKRIEDGDFVPVRRARADAPGWLARIIERALSPDPAQRFADGSALVAAFENPERVAAAERPRDLRTLAVALGALALACAVGTAVFLGARTRDDAPLQRAVDAWLAIARARSGCPDSLLAADVARALAEQLSPERRRSALADADAVLAPLALAWGSDEVAAVAAQHALEALPGSDAARPRLTIVHARALLRSGRREEGLAELAKVETKEGARAIAQVLLDEGRFDELLAVPARDDVQVAAAQAWARFRARGADPAAVRAELRKLGSAGQPFLVALDEALACAALAKARVERLSDLLIDSGIHWKKVRDAASAMIAAWATPHGRLFDAKADLAALENGLRCVAFSPFDFLPPEQGGSRESRALTARLTWDMEQLALRIGGEDSRATWIHRALAAWCLEPLPYPDGIAKPEDDAALRNAFVEKIVPLAEGEAAWFLRATLVETCERGLLAKKVPLETYYRLIEQLVKVAPPAHSSEDKIDPGLKYGLRAAEVCARIAAMSPDQRGTWLARADAHLDAARKRAVPNTIDDRNVAEIEFIVAFVRQDDEAAERAAQRFALEGDPSFDIPLEYLLVGELRRRQGKLGEAAKLLYRAAELVDSRGALAEIYRRYAEVQWYRADPELALSILFLKGDAEQREIGRKLLDRVVKSNPPPAFPWITKDVLEMIEGNEKTGKK